MGMGYVYLSKFYRSSARELKRLDSMLRSFLYAHFAESLSGLPTIRSYGEIPRFLSDNEYYIDLEDRANFLVATNQRWLAIRLDFLGGLMVFVVSSRMIRLSCAGAEERLGRDARCYGCFGHQCCSDRSRLDLH